MAGRVAEVGSELDRVRMARALELGRAVRAVASPNPWVGCVIDARGDVVGEGATAVAGGPHAEPTALAAAQDRARGATCYVTLEPCAHEGHTPPCVDALLAAGVRRVVVAIEDPDHRVRGTGLARLREAGVEVLLGVGGAEAERDLAAYLVHRRTGRPLVVVKWAATLDGRIAAPDGSSRWITGEPARRDAHRLRAESDAIAVGARTVVADDPALTVRLWPDPDPDAVYDPGAGQRGQRWHGRQPLRVVLGTAPPQARVHPALEWLGTLPDLLDELGRRMVLQLLVEGGARLAHAFVAEQLVDRFVAYLAPMLLGGDDGVPTLRGDGSPSIVEARRLALVSLERIGDDIRIECDAPRAGTPGCDDRSVGA